MKYTAIATTLVLTMATQLMACEDAGGLDTDADTDSTPDRDTDPLTGTTEQTVSVGGVDRTYLLTVPESYSGDEAVPLLLNFHALQDSAEGQLAISGFEALAEQEGFLLVTPQAVGGVWTVTGFPLSNGADDRGFITALVDELLSTLRVDPRRMYATGMSQGGFLSFDLVCGSGPPLAAIAPVSGVMTPDMIASCAPMRPLPVLQVHGTEDAQIPYDGAESAVQWWVAFNEASPAAEVSSLPDTVPDDGTTIDQLVYAGGASGGDVVHLRINGGGHDWPGSAGDTDVDIAEEIWGFVSRYDIDGRIEE